MKANAIIQQADARVAYPTYRSALQSNENAVSPSHHSNKEIAGAEQASSALTQHGLGLIVEEFDKIFGAWLYNRRPKRPTSALRPWACLLYCVSESVPSRRYWILVCFKSDAVGRFMFGANDGKIKLQSVCYIKQQHPDSSFQQR